ncbi:MAG: NAD(+) synthase [Candidatus Electrothrix sp. AW5]|nr:NAD(+) synthase [Candidatus Electrothrix sp. AX1]MCI5181814.1 NAD(+) synthase [Candidatus Electrothrix gigas]MCI5196310.1 NAD(+) synthase [Candidatus Electrothrix gigas]
MNKNYAQIEKSIKRYIKEKVGDNKVLIGLSGGLDSSLLCLLAADALGKDKVKALSVKRAKKEKNLKLCQEFAQKYKLPLSVVSTKKMRKDAIKKCNIDTENVIDISTMDARLIAFMIKETARKDGRICLGTINGTERLTGWYPKGCLVGDFAPLGGLFKMQEKGMAKKLGLEHLIYTVSESADRICSVSGGGGSCSELEGISYDDLDEILYTYHISSKEDLFANLLALKMKKDTILRVLKRVSFVAHKMDVFPNYCRVNF